MTALIDPIISTIIADGPATGILPVPHRRPITVIGTDAIRAGFDAGCLQQAINSAAAPGVTHVVLNPDAHLGYGAPVGSVLVSPTHIYPGPVGHDGTADALARRLALHLAAGTVRNFPEKISQLGSYGGGNHFGECEIVRGS